MGSRPIIPAGVTTGADVELATLSLGERIGGGGGGVVFRVNGNRTLAFKQYKSPGDINGASLFGLVRFRTQLNVSQRRWIDSHCAWPMCRVVQHGISVGFVMRRASADYTWRTNYGKTRLLELQYLIRPHKEAWASVPEPEPQWRLQLAVKYGELVRQLHRWGIVIGDISHANILWKVDPEPDLYLIDCDSARLRGHEPVAPQPDTDQWNDEHQFGRPTLDSDRYKSALVIGRILACTPYYRPGNPVSFVPGVLTRQQESMVRGLLALAGNPTNRPTMDRWTSALSGNYPNSGPVSRRTTPASSTSKNADSARNRPTIYLRRPPSSE